MEKRTIELTIDTARRWFNGNDEELKALAVQTYPELNKPKWARTREDLGEISGWYITTDSDILKDSNFKPMDSHAFNVNPYKQIPKAYVALCQLHQFRYEMVGDWMPEVGMYATTIYYKISGGFSISECNGGNRHMTFQTNEQAEWFLEHHLELLKEASIFL